jgi:hypothetical protein
VQVIPATSDSNIGDADAIRNAFNFLYSVNQSEPNAAVGAQNPGFYALLREVNQSEFNTGVAARNVFASVPEVNSIGTARLGPKTCNVRCFVYFVIPICHFNCNK